MEKDTAVRLLELADTCTNAIAATIESAKQRAPGRGADFFDSFVSPVWGEVIIGFMSTAWDQYPELQEGPEIPPAQAYDPDWFNLPKDVVVDAFQSLGRVQRMVSDIGSLLAASQLEPEERSRFERFLAEVQSDLRQARRMVTDQHPDFRGPDPKEEIPEMTAPSNNGMHQTKRWS